MPKIYAVSDIHGFFEPMQEALKRVDLIAHPNNKLIFLGDYIDIGRDSFKVLIYIKELQVKHPDQVIVLLGNHEEMFLDWVFGSDELRWLSFDNDLKTVKSFIPEENLENIVIQARENISNSKSFYKNMNDLFVKCIKDNHIELLKWLQKLPRYYETDNQIFVHAGILEEAEDLWKHGTPIEYFTQKFPAETGKFFKDIVAGHVGTASVANDNSYLGKVFWDGENHFYIDGTVDKSVIVPVLMYDMESGKYSSFKRVEKNDGMLVWEEYMIEQK